MLMEEKLKKIAYTECGGIDEYYEERTALLSDIQFFNLFMKREKKSSFNFRVAVDQNCCTLFTDLWRRWGFYSDSEEIIETVFVEYLCLKKLIEDVLDETLHHKNEEMLSEEEMAYLISYFNVRVYAPLHKKESKNLGISVFRKKLKKKEKINLRKGEKLYEVYEL